MTNQQATLLDLIVPIGAYPWKNYTSPGEALTVIDRFAAGKSRSWAKLTPLVDSDSEPKDAAQKALAQQVLRAQKTVLERLASSPESPMQVVKRLMLGSAGRRSSELNLAFSRFVRVDMYSKGYPEQTENVLDVRDFGFGMDRYSLLNIFDSDKDHHLAARGSYEYAPITLVASRCENSQVSIVVIRRMISANGARYYYLINGNGELPTVNATHEQFPTGTLVRHLGYEAPLYNPWKENSVQGALDRNLPGLKFPIATFYHDLRKATPRSQHRVAVGTTQLLALAIAAQDVQCATSRREVESQPYQVHRYDFVRANHGGSPTNDVLRQHCRPGESVLFVQDGQTIATACCPASITRPTLIMLDVSKLSAATLLRIRRDLRYRSELVTSALAIRKRSTLAEASVVDPAALVDPSKLRWTEPHSSPSVPSAPDHSMTPLLSSSFREKLSDYLRKVVSR